MTIFARRLWIVVIAVLLAGCVVKDESGAFEGGRRLPGTETIAGGVDELSVSPDGRFIFYSTGAVYADSKPAYVLYRTANQQPLEVQTQQASADLKDDRFLHLRRGCWSQSSDRIYLVELGTLEMFYIDAAQEPPSLRWEAGASAQEQRKHLECDNGIRATGVFRAVKQSGEEVSLVLSDAPQKVVARHQKASMFSQRIAISRLSFSPSGRYLAYGVTEFSGSVTRGTTLYVLDSKSSGRATARKFAYPVHGSALWSLDGSTLYAWVGGRGNGLYRWQLGTNTH